MNPVRTEKGAVLLFLILAIMAMGLIGGYMAINTKAARDEQAIKFTVSKLKRIAIGISSSNYDPSGQTMRHYEDDVGSLPTTLDNLVNTGAACTLSTTTGLLSGWCGPYWQGTFTGEDINKDGWGNTIVLSTANRYLYSKGLNAADNSGGSDDLLQRY